MCLANSPSDYGLVGGISLRGRLSVIFDSTNSEGEEFNVFDVQHGSVFRCYNSAAASLVAGTAFGGPEIPESDLIEWMSDNRDDLERGFWVARLEDLPGSQFEEICENRKKYGTRQILNIIHTIKKGPSSGKAGRRGGARRTASREPAQKRCGKHGRHSDNGPDGTLVHHGMPWVGVAGTYRGISRSCAHAVICRPQQYLCNREKYNKGCMLAAVHEKAAVWTLYHGDRGLIDSLLNKPMIDHLKPTRLRRFVFTWFLFAEILQIIAMIFVAGQKGWDSLVLLILIIAVGNFSKLYGYNMHARNWLNREGFETVAFQCEFPGRTELMAVVPTLSTEKRTLWMDGIIAPITRRDVLLQRLDVVNCNMVGGQQSFDALEERDKVWVMSNFAQAKAASTLIEEKPKRISESV